MNDKKTIPALHLGEKLRFENDRLYFGEEADAPSVMLTTLHDDDPVSGDKLDLPVLQACYSLVRQSILNLASRGGVPGTVFPVSVYLDEFLDMLGYDGDEDEEARIDYAAGRILSCGNICAAYKPGGFFSVLSLLAIDRSDPDGCIIEFMCCYVNKIAIDALTRGNVV